MLAKPTIEDFARLLDWHLDKAAAAAEREFKAITTRRNAEGRYRSGGTVTEVFEAVHSEFDKGVHAALGELTRIASKTVLDRHHMRRLTEEGLRRFAERCKGATRPATLRTFAPAGPIDQRLAKFDTDLEHHLRQFDVGFLEVFEPEVPPIMSASIIAHNVSGVAIQQGTAHSTQHVAGEINIPQARLAIAAFEHALEDASTLAVDRNEINGDLNTIKAQLSKTSYSKAIVIEAGRSLRNLVEGAISNALMPPALANAAAALWKALGLG